MLFMLCLIYKNYYARYGCMLLIFALLKKCFCMQTGIWDKIDQVEKCLSVLQHGIDVSRHEFKEILENGLSKKDVEKLQGFFSITFFKFYKIVY